MNNASGQDGQNQNQTGQNQGVVWTGFLLGAALGTLSTLLLAPRSGRETRAQLRSALEEMARLTEDLTLDVQGQAERLSEQALKQWEDTLNRLRESIAAGIEASQTEARQQSYGRPIITVPAESSQGVDLPSSPEDASEEV
jgi:gas vesicle protein